jgi:hypothetical protein
MQLGGRASQPMDSAACESAQRREPRPRHATELRRPVQARNQVVEGAKLFESGDRAKDPEFYTAPLAAARRHPGS